ncbi:glutathione S-transferase, partial [Pseudomonas syringae pv. tagetis]
LSMVLLSVSHPDPYALAAGCRQSFRHMQILDRQLDATGSYVICSEFSLADIPKGLSVNLWIETPVTHPDFTAVKAYY